MTAPGHLIVNALASRPTRLVRGVAFFALALLALGWTFAILMWL